MGLYPFAVRPYYEIMNEETLINYDSFQRVDEEELIPTGLKIAYSLVS